MSKSIFYHKTPLTKIINVDLKDEKPVTCAVHPLPINDREIVKEIIEDQIDRGILQYSTCEYQTPWFLVNKSDGKKCLVIHYSLLNKKIKEVTVSLNIRKFQHFIHKIYRKIIYSKVDLRQAFHLVRVNPKDCHKLSFSIGSYFLMPRAAPAGLKISPAHLHQVVSEENSQIVNRFAYFDDLILTSNSMDKYLKSLDHLSKLLKQCEIYINLKKCEFFKKEMIFLGLKVTEQGITATVDRLNAKLNLPLPDTIRQLRTFLQFFRHDLILKKVALKTAKANSQLYKLVSSTQKRNTQIKWTKSLKAAFYELREKLCAVFTCRIQCQMVNLNCILNFAMGAYLSQKNNKTG